VRDEFDPEAEDLEAGEGDLDDAELAGPGEDEPAGPGGPADGGPEEEDLSGAAGGARLIIVDGEAVVRGNATLLEAWVQDPAEAVSRLVNLLSWAMAHQGAEFALVIEPEARVDERDAAAAHVRQHVPEAGQSVSQAVIALAEEARAAGRPATVVTSDVEVVRFAARERIQADLADLFAASLLGGESPDEQDVFEKPAGLSAKESAEWDAFVVTWKGLKKP